MADNQVRKGWEECIVMSGKGSRIVHYILRDTTGSSLLAVVGTERSVRHMIYTVSVDYLRVFGSTGTINAQTSWRTRAEVVSWLSSLVANKGPIFPNPGQKVIQTTTSTVSQSIKPMAGEEPGSSNIVWVGDAWTCNNQLKHYLAFKIKGIYIPVYSFVNINCEEDGNYPAYVVDLYEDKESKKMAKVRWFILPKDVKDLPFGHKTHPQEVIMTHDEQEMSVACINDIVFILTPNHFKSCIECVPQTSTEMYVCNREITEHKIKPFYLSKMPGYSTQPILTSLISQRKTSPAREVIADPNLSIISKPRSQFKVDDNVEYLSQDSGIRGCWFRCKILAVSQKRVKLQYLDLEYDDEPDQKPEELVSSSKVANPDKLGKRHDGRLTIRPWPSQDSTKPTKFELGTAFDAWCDDSWSEGFMTGYGDETHSIIQLYMPGSNKFVTVEKKHIRVSKDWIEGKWMDIEPMRDILSYISSILNPMPKLQPLPSLHGPSTLTSDKSNMMPQAPKDHSLPSTSMDDKIKSKEELNLKKRLMKIHRQDHEELNSKN